MKLTCHRTFSELSFEPEIVPYWLAHETRTVSYRKVLGRSMSKRNVQSESLQRYFIIWTPVKNDAKNEFNETTSCKQIEFNKNGKWLRL